MAFAVGARILLSGRNAMTKENANSANAANCY